MTNFKNPPINELVLDVQFRPIVGLTSLDLGVVRKIFEKEYPTYEEKTPVAEETERYDNVNFLKFNMGAAPPQLRRQWYINEDADRLFQFQENRFIHNWRRRDLMDTSKNSYPRFEKLFPNFSKYFSKLETFAKEKSGEPLVMTQWEITKFNFIPLSRENWSEDLNETFTFALDMNVEKNLVTEGLSYNKRSLLLSDGKPLGRMYVALEVVDHEKEQKAAILRFSLKGHADGEQVVHCFKQIETGNRLINEAFVASTTEKARKEKWGQE